MERKFNFSVGEFYHLYGRGVEKRTIFLDPIDYSRFIKLLYIANSEKPFEYKLIGGLPLEKVDRGESLVNVGAYCLMPNHFHLLVREKIESGISKFMSKLMTAYSMYFNKKNDRTGRLFQSTFKAKHADKDDYLRYLFSYIHLNPLKLKKPDWREADLNDLFANEQFLHDYRFSSGLDYCGLRREENLILETSAFPEYFSKPHEFKGFIRDWVEIKNSEDYPWK